MIRIDVQSAVQASYAGPPFDFGEVGDLTDAQAQSFSIVGMVRVASTGPYSVALSSANAYRMTYPGGSPAISTQSLRYSVRLLGQTRDSTWPIFSTIACARPAVPARTCRSLSRCVKAARTNLPHRITRTH
jgi:hypothetical protein